MNIYWIVLIVTAVLALLFKNNKKGFVISASAVHTFVCGFRYMYMHGDLRKYAYEFILIQDYDWKSEELLRGGRNTLFYVLNKLVAECANNDFQVLLFIIALASSTAIGIMIYKYSSKPFISYLVWNCFGYYMFSFYSIKQTLAMAFVMLAAIGIFENNWKKFTLFTVIAGFIHLPAFAFLPAYPLSRLKKKESIATVYVLIFAAVFLFRNTIVSAVSDLYYESDKYTEASGGLGGKCIMMIALLIAGYLLCGLSNDRFRKLFMLISLASLLQFFSMYDNVFTRLADYYFQFLILYAPCMLAQVHEESELPPIYFNKTNQQILAVAFVLLALFFYKTTTLDAVPAREQDNLLNYSFMWEH